MSEVIAQRKIGILLGYCSLGLRSAVGIALIPFIIHHIGISDYGVYSLVASLAIYLIILELGLANTTIRFLSKYNAQNDTQGESRFLGIMLSIYTVITLLTVGVGIGLYFSLPNIFENSLSASEVSLLQQAFLILLVSVAVTLMSNSLTGLITVHERFGFLKSTEIVVFIIRTLLVVILLQQDYGLITIVVIDTAMSLIQAILKVWYVSSRLQVKISWIVPDKMVCREIFTYTAFIALNVIVNQINWRADNFILGVMTDSRSLGIFNIGSQLLLAYITLASAVSNVFTPKLMKMVNTAATQAQLTSEMIHIGRLQLFVLGFILAAFIGFGPLFIHLFVGEEYQIAFWIALIPMVPLTLVLTQAAASSILQAMNKHKVRSLLLLATAIFNILLSIVLIEHYGIVGASIGTASALVLGELILVGIYLNKVVGLQMARFYRSLLLSTAPTIAITAVFGYSLAHYMPATWLGLVLGVMFSLGTYILILYFVSLSRDEKTMFKHLVGITPSSLPDVAAKKDKDTEI